MPYIYDKAGKFEAAIIAYFAKKKSGQIGKNRAICFFKKMAIYFISYVEINPQHINALLHSLLPVAALFFQRYQ